MKCWVVTYFETTRFGNTIERERIYGPSLKINEVRKIADKFIFNQQMKGKAVMSQYDLVQEMRA